MVVVSLVLYDIKRLKEILNCINLFSQVSKILKIFILNNSDIDFKNKLPIKDSIIYIHTPKNIGYGKAINLILKNNHLPKSKYIIVSNTDINFNPDHLNKTIDYLISKQEIKILSPKIIDRNNNIYDNFRGFYTFTELFLKYFFGFVKKNSKVYFDNSKIKNPLCVNHVSGSFMIIDSKIFRKLRGFDKNFFLYFEDTDFCRRAKKYGEILYYPYFSITHDHKKDHSVSFKIWLVSLFSASYFLIKWSLKFKETNKFNNQLNIDYNKSIDEQ